MNWKLRSYRPADCQVLADLFYETVHTVNAGDYTEEQLFAWTAAVILLSFLFEKLVFRLLRRVLGDGPAV